MMQAQILYEPKPIEQEPLRLVDLPIPNPAAGEVRLRILACGVCRTDLHTVEGDLELYKTPIVPGHQVVGIIDALGKGVTRFNKGQKVGAVWLYRTCGECRYCITERENLCRMAAFTGFHFNGGYAEYTVVDSEFIFSLPSDIPDEQIAPLLCGGVIGYRALRLTGVQKGEKVGLYGFGNSAHIAIQVARYKNCQVFVFTRNEEHQELARKLGAVWVGKAEDDPPSGIDKGIIFAPSGDLVPKALRVLNPGGTLVMAGIHMSPIPELPYELLYKERSLCSVTNSTRQDAIDLLQLSEEIPIRTEVSTFPLAEANSVLRAMKESRINGDAVLIP